MADADHLNLGLYRPLQPTRSNREQTALLPSHHLVTHAVLMGMTGSGKTGPLMVMLEEALRAGVPCLVVDVKGDLPNLRARSAWAWWWPHRTPWTSTTAPSATQASGAWDACRRTRIASA